MTWRRSLACAVVAVVGVGALPAVAGASSSPEGTVECRIDETWDLVQDSRFSLPIQCDLNPGEAGSFAIDPAVILDAAVALGANDDGGDVVWIEAWGPRDGAYAFTSTRFWDLDLADFVYGQSTGGSTMLFYHDSSGRIHPLVNADLRPGSAMARPLSVFDPKVDVQGPGSTRAVAPTAIDMTAPLEPQPKPASAGDVGMIRFTFNQGSSEYLYPVIVEFESDDILSLYADGTWFASLTPYGSQVKVNLAGFQQAILRKNRQDRLYAGLEFVPQKRFDSFATFSWSGDVREVQYGVISGPAYYESPVVVATLD